MLSFTLVAAALSAVVSAQQPVWAQCGGMGWTGSTTCVSGSTCVASNPYYSQCLPSASTPPTTTAATSTPSSTSTPQAGVNYWISFGDSYTQTGFSPTGNPLPNIKSPLGNPTYPGATGGGGVNWVDVMTVQYNASLLLTWNFAYGGATIDATIVQPYSPSVLSLTDQVNQYMTYLSQKPASAPWTSSNTIFSIWIGINDIGGSYGSGGSLNAKLMSAYFALVQKLYNTGARNFLFVNVPPVDRSPLMLSQPASSQALEKTVIADYNSKLVAAINSFKANNTGVTTWLWDSNAAFTTILDNPKAYGFKDATSYGQTGSFWGNNYHPGGAAHTIFGQDVSKQLNSTIWW